MWWISYMDLKGISLLYALELNGEKGNLLLQRVCFLSLDLEAKC